MLQRLLILVFLSCSIHAANAATNDFQNWSLITIEQNLNEKFGYYLEFQNRLVDHWTDQDLLILRPALKYNLNDKVSLYQGYDWFSTYRQDLDVEHRLWQQILIKNKYKKFSNMFWARLEERFLPNSDDLALRARFRLGISHPITSDEKWAVEVFDELFVHLYDVKEGPDAGFDQNWIYLGLKRKLGDFADIHVGYLLNLLDRDVNQLQHAFRTTLSFNL